MLSSGYLIRPCDGGGSIIHIVDHLNLEVSRIFLLYILCLLPLILNQSTCIVGLECS